MDKKYIVLSSKVAVYVPCTIGNKNLTETEQKEYVYNTADKLSEWFGGATIVDSIGFWRNPDTGELVTENTKQVISFTTTDALKCHSDSLITLCEELRKQMEQYSIALEINNQMYIIEG